MEEKASTTLKQLQQFWAGLPTPKRIALVAITLGVLIAVLAVSVLGSRENYAVLYTDLSTEDASAIVEQLNKQQVPHQLDGAGTIIKVPAERVHSLRLELASSGLPRGGGVGFELFDRSQIGATEFEQQVNLRRALEGELSRSIGTVQGVKAARVHLVLPERRLFVSKRESSSASVVLKLDNAQAFGRKEVAGIVHLVAAAVPGLTRERVSVVSTEGVTLHRPDTGDGTGVGGYSDLAGEQSRVVAGQLETHVREQLERVVGTGNADVRINVALDPAQKERTAEHYEPSKTALRSEHKVEEATGDQEGGVAGVPGARTNLPDAREEGQAPPEEQLAAGGGGRVRSQTRNWEVDRVTEKQTTPPGSIQRLSVAVLLNGRWVKKGNADVFVPRKAGEIKELEALVKRAVGFDEQRGDTVEVRAMKFAKIDGVQDPGPIQAPVWRQWWVPYAAAGLAFLLLVALLILIWRSSAKKAKQIELAELARVELEQRQQAPAELAGRPAGALGPGEAEGLPDRREDALRLAAQDPATAAVVIKQWLRADAPQAAAT